MSVPDRVEDFRPIRPCPGVSSSIKRLLCTGTLARRFAIYASGPVPSPVSLFWESDRIATHRDPSRLREQALRICHWSGGAKLR